MGIECPTEAIEEIKKGGLKGEREIPEEDAWAALVWLVSSGGREGKEGVAKRRERGSGLKGTGEDIAANSDLPWTLPETLKEICW